MPLNETLMATLKKRYGEKKGEEVYWGMAGEGKGPFGPRGKYRAEHEAIAAKAGGPPAADTKKARRKGGSPRRASRRRR